MMAQVNAGRVRFVGRGEYNNSTQYYVFDLVSYNGNSYYAKVDTIGHLPTDTTYWQLVAEKGNVGPTGLTGNGISSIEKTSTSGLVDTYTITYTNGNTTTFDVSNGNGIDRIEKTATVGNKDTYTIYFTNGSTTTYEVSNGEVTREELEEEVERLSMIYNAFPSTTGEVEEGSINGTAEVPFKEIGLKGNTSQESTTGKNLANIKNIPNQTGQPTLTVANDTISISNSPSSIGYTSTNIKLSDLCPNLQVGDTVYLFYNTTSSSSQKTIIYLSGANVSWAYNGGSKTITQEMLDSTVILYGGKDETAIISNFMITKTNDSTYEPYTNGPAPNPDYPYPVNVVTGDNEVKVEGKNLCPTQENAWEQGSINSANGSLTSSTTRLRTKDYYSIKNDTDYYISIQGTTDYCFLNIHFYNANKQWISSMVDYDNIDGKTSKAINIASSSIPNIAYMKIVVRNKINDATITTSEISTIKPQIELGTSFTGFEEYQSQTYPINLGSMELCKIGDYQDYLYKENGIWCKYGAIGKYTFGNETINWTSGGTVGNNYYFYTQQFDGLYNGESFLCDKLITNVNASTKENVIRFTSSWSNIRIYISTNLIENTITSLNNWLANNKPIIYIPLTTPTITEITDTTLIEQLDNLEKAYSYDTQTNISQTNQDKPFIISYEAILSLRNVLNS